MKKQNENCLYNHETKIIQDIKNMIIYIKQSVIRKTVQHMSQKNKKNIIFKHQKNIIRKKNEISNLKYEKVKNNASNKQNF